MVEAQKDGFAARLVRAGGLEMPVGNVAVTLDQRGIGLAGEGGGSARIPFGDITRIRFGAHPMMIFIWRAGAGGKIVLYPTGLAGHAEFVRGAYDRIRRARPDAIVETGWGYLLPLIMLGGLAVIYLTILVVLPLLMPEDGDVLRRYGVFLAIPTVGVIIVLPFHIRRFAPRRVVEPDDIERGIPPG